MTIIWLLFAFASVAQASDHATLYEQKRVPIQGTVEIRHHTHQHNTAKDETLNDQVQMQIRSTLRLEKGRVRFYGTWGLTKDPGEAHTNRRPYEYEVNVLAYPVRYLQMTGYGIFKQWEPHKEMFGGVYQIGLNHLLKVPVFQFFGSWHSISTFDISTVMWQHPPQHTTETPLSFRGSSGVSWLPPLSHPWKASLIVGHHTRLDHPAENTEDVATFQDIGNTNSYYRIRNEWNLTRDIHLLYDFFHYFDGYFERSIVGGRRYKHILRTVITF